MSAVIRTYFSVFDPVLRLDAHVLRAVCLFLALVIYAFFGSPTPDAPGIYEALIAALLIAAVGFVDASRVLKVDGSAPLWQGAGQLLLLYGGAVGLVVALINGHEMRFIVRDIVPFIFMLMPVFFIGLVKAYPATFKYLLAGVCVIGVLFALRATQDVGDFLISLFVPDAQGELTYLANAPTLLFAAMFLFGEGVLRFCRTFTAVAALRFIVLSALAVVVLVPVALTTQRASLGYVGVYVTLISVYLFYKYPQRMSVVLLVAMIAALPFYGIIAELIGSLHQKTSLVGFNARFEELSAVWNEISRNPLSMIFGAGWGGTFESPAVAGIRVNFTHSLLSSMLLKLGLSGLVLVVLYLFGLARALMRLLSVNPVLALALAGPIAIDVFLYASFKSLDFGLVLLMIPAALSFEQARRVKQTP